MSTMRTLIPLKTLAEVDASEDTIEANVIQLPSKFANEVHALLQPLVPVRRLPHLRRIVNWKHLPQSLRSEIVPPVSVASTIYLLVPSQHSSAKNIYSFLCSHLTDSNVKPTFLRVDVPVRPPTSAAQALRWSQTYWPCTYNPASLTLQNAPPLQTLRTVQAQLEAGPVADYLQLARDAAEENKSLGYGQGVGAVIVDPVLDEVVSLAGDARWWTPDPTNLDREYWRNSNGRPEHHALMRAIAMVAEKELRRREVPTASTNTLRGRPLTELERYYFETPPPEEEVTPDRTRPPRQSMPRPDIYLCNGLDVYLTHEPCVACSMAMVHSRFRACVFQTTMPETGALTAEKEGGLAYGLFWRKELNWRVMTFQYEGAVNGDKFHA